MTDLGSSPSHSIALWLVDGAMLWLTAEAVVLLVRHRLRRDAPGSLDVLWSLLSGFWLMAGLHGVLAGSEVAVLALCLSAAGLCHATDLWCRLSRHGRTRGKPSSASAMTSNHPRRTP